MTETSGHAGRNADGDGAAEFFDAMYQGAAREELTLPWHRDAAHPVLVEWAERRGVRGAGRRAVIVGCGLGVDAEYIAGLGFATVAFDVSPAAIDLAKKQNPGSPVTYTTADLLNLPTEWLRAFDLVVEIYTAQALPDPPRAAAIAGIGRLVAAGGTLLAVAFVGDEYTNGGLPPWPLTRAEIDAFAADGLVPVAVDVTTYSGAPRFDADDDRLWRAEFQRPGEAA